MTTIEKKEFEAAEQVNVTMQSIRREEYKLNDWLKAIDFGLRLEVKFNFVKVEKQAE